MQDKSNVKQNVVVIVCDELRANFLGAYGCDFIPTPNIDELAKNGVTFDNSITASTVCAPARASMITGQLVSCHGTWTNRIPCKEGTEYLPERVAENGYMTAGVGIFDHAPLDLTLGYQYRNWFMEGKMECEYLKGLKKKYPEAGTFNPDETGLHFKYAQEDFYDFWTAEKAVEFIDCYTQTGKAPDGTAPQNENAPFFLYCGFLSPHTPLNPPKEVSGRVDINKLPKIRTTMRDDDIPDVEKNRRAYLNPHEALTNPEKIAEERMKKRLAYAELIVEVDDLVGKIVQSLKNSGIYENTTIIFTADHGSMDNDYNMATKGPWPYKEQLFVPLIVSNHPRAKRGTRSDCLCGNLDVGATVLDIIGDHKAFGISRSLLGMADGSIAEREVNISEFCDSCKTVVDKQYTFTYYPFTGKTCLYDRINDPDETVNLGGQKEYTEIQFNFMKHALDYMLIAKGIRIEAHDLIPCVKEGIEKKHPLFLDDFKVAFPLHNQEAIERLKQAGLPWDYNEFCKDKEVVVSYVGATVYTDKK